MSDRAVSQATTRSKARTARYLAALGLLAAAALVGLLDPLPRAAVARKPDDDPLGVDDKRPLGAVDAKRVALIEKLRIPNPNAQIFVGHKDPKTGKIEGGIEDYKPLASEKENADEYQALHVFVSHASQFPNAELEQNAARDLVRDDFLNPTRFEYRFNLARFDGRLLKVRRAPATKSLAESGIAELYEGLLVPFDEPPNAVISVVFTEVPAGLEGLKEKPAGEWMEVNARAVAAGYSFKVKQDAPGLDAMPVFIGRSVTLVKSPAPAPGGPADYGIALNKKLRVFQHIRDDSFMTKPEDGWEEVSAWHRVLLHARQFTPEELEQAAAELPFAELFVDNRRDYKLDLVKFEGRLIKLDKLKPGDKLAAAGVEAFYEGWLVPKDEPSGHPICIGFTDAPEGIEPKGRVNKWVSFAGYSFKLLRYKSGETDKKDPTRNVTKKAPLLLGRAVIARTDPEAPVSTGWKGFINGVVAVIAGVLLLGGGVAWWFRRGDRQARNELETHRVKNPFQAGSA